MHLARAAEAEDARLDGHRGVMRAVKKAVVLALHPDSPKAGDPALVRAASERTAELEALQAGDGLFTGGDNLASPPDSAFTINDAALTVRLLRDPIWPDDLRERLTRILRAAAPALLAGGVHTPNHRWELAAALARSGTVLDAPALLDRAREWLSEGIDVDADGLYSERSPNYASRVSNPSLTVLADLLDRPDLLDVVHRNLHAQLDLTSRDGTVETLHSRRQDQHDPFPLGPFLGQLTRAALHHSCTRCADGARRAADAPGVPAVDVLAEQLLDPSLAAPLPAGTSPGRARCLFRDARLLRETRQDTEFTVYGGSDIPAAGRIASGLACNPTFLRMRAGAVAVQSVRLSRDFFGLGPFRAEEMSVSGDRIVLRETVSAAYYQPLPPAARHDDGGYALEHEGRFAARMSFGQRSRDPVTLTTTVDVRLHSDGADLTVTTDGPATAHALEIALSPGGELAGAVPLGDDRFELVAGTATYTADGATLRIGPGAGSGPDRPPVYRPGEAYTVTGGTDALGGTRLYLAWRSPGAVEVALRYDPPEWQTPGSTRSG
jgi:hypothetical protein